MPNQRHATNSYKVEESQWKCRYSFNLYNIPCKKEEINCGKRVCQGHNPKRSGNADRGEVIYNGSYTDYETELHQSLDEKIVSADVKSVRKVEKRSVDRDANMRLERNRNLIDTTSSTREPSDIRCKLLQQQAATPKIDISGNPLNYHYFMVLFPELLEFKIDDPR